MKLAPARLPIAHVENDVAQYLYCIMRCREPRNFETLGIGERGDAVRTINFKDMATVASDSPEPRYDNTRRNMMAHMRVPRRGHGGLHRAADPLRQRGAEPRRDP